MYDYNENDIIIDGAKVATSEAVYRNAYPAFRVFVFYQEVTNDVIEIHTNNTGGSAERMAGSATITLSNPLERYLISTPDITMIGAERAKINDRANKLAFTKSMEIQGQYDQLREEISSLAASGNIEGLSSYLETAGLNPDDFIVSTNDGVRIINQESMLAAIMEAGQTIIDNRELGQFNYYFEENPNSIKYNVLKRKLAYKTRIVYDRNTNLVRYNSKVVFDYPFQRGDCIFHPNDAVRIAFRDPFDARMWYWKFSGFVDSCSESVGSNKESTIVLTCTDVTKMARYTYAQINTGILDEMILPDGTISSDKGTDAVLFFKELFAGFEIHEILEILFFGAESLEKNLNLDVRNYIAGLSDEEAIEYLLKNFNSIKNDIDLQNAIFNTENAHDVNLQTAVRDMVYEVRQSQVIGRLPSLRNLGVISHPSGVQFRRKNEKRGVNVYFYGETDEYDKQIGEGIKDLKTWNELIHHRVRKSDLNSMSIDGDGLNKFPGVGEWDIQKIISIIGNNENNIYPVGCGNVYYFTSAGLRKRLGSDAIDRSFGGPSSMHSEFIDDLTLLYDLAENVEYYFYATPKGDVIFEMPFYDFDLDDFVNQEDFTDSSFDVDELIREYDTLFREAYSGSYEESDLLNMTNLIFKITKTGTNYQVNDYSKLPIFDYLSHFTVEGFEQYGYSNSSSDVGVCTVARSSPMLVKSISTLNTLERKHAMVQLPNLFPMLGIRMMSGGMLGFIDNYAIAQAYLGLQLNRVNSEARTLSISTVPKFGLMVNRPLKWRAKTYSANIASISDSIAWNSSCDTTINLNQIRGWSGEIDSQTGKPVMEHFGGSRPFDLAKLLKGDDEDKK